MPVAGWVSTVWRGVVSWIVSCPAVRSFNMYAPRYCTGIYFFSLFHSSTVVASGSTHEVFTELLHKRYSIHVIAFVFIYVFLLMIEYFRMFYLHLKTHVIRIIENKNIFSFLSHFIVSVGNMRCTMFQWCPPGSRSKFLCSRLSSGVTENPSDTDIACRCVIILWR